MIPCVLSRPACAAVTRAPARRGSTACPSSPLDTSRQGGGRDASATPDLASLFQEAQQNILRLNQSRLNALSDLKLARERVNELERKLADAAAAAEASQRAAPDPIETGEARTLQREPDQPSTKRELLLDRQAPASTAGQRNVVFKSTQAQERTKITIAYGTGWNNAYIHFKTSEQDWTQAPGVQMQSGTGDLAGSKVATILDAEGLEFVITNGENDWDTPDPYGCGKQNYKVASPGTYYLKSGRLQKL